MSKSDTAGYAVADYPALRRRMRELARTYRYDGSSVLHFDANRRVSVDWASGCDCPHSHITIARPGVAKYDGTHTDPGKGLVLEESFRCRKCGPCLEHKALVWMARAGAEYRHYRRTWLVTLTMSPSNHSLFGLKALKVWRSKGVLRAPSDTELLACQMSVYRKMAYRWLRDLAGRKAGVDRSYCCVFEVHDSENTSREMRGKVHMHMLVHETGTLFDDEDCEFAMERGELVYRLKIDSRGRRLWRFGILDARLCRDEGGAVYMARYLHKRLKGANSKWMSDADADDTTVDFRIGASPHYGDPDARCKSSSV